MTDNEGSVNKQQDKEQANRELDPWLRKRLEERARPLTSHGLLQLVQSGSHLARWVMTHTGLSSLISQAGRLTFLSGAYRSIIRRTTTAELPYSYGILDLPWFRPGQSMSQQDIEDIGSNPQENTISDAVDKSKDTLRQLPDQSAKEKEAKGHEKTSLHPLSESTKEKKTVSNQKKPETYINRLISPPITRKTTVDIGNQIVSTAIKKSPPVQTGQMTEVTYPSVLDKLPERRTAVSSERRPEIPVRNPPISAKSAPDVSKLKLMQSHQTGSTLIKSSDISKSDKPRTESAKEKTDEIVERPKDVYARPPLKSTQQMTPPIIPSEKSTGLSDTSSRVSDISQSNQQKTIGRETLPSRIKNQQDRSVETVESPTTDFIATPDQIIISGRSDTKQTKKGDSPSTQPFTEMGHKTPTTEKPQLNKSSGTGQNKLAKEASQVYPAQDLFYRKPLSIGKRIVQSLPIIRNILRKDDRAPLTVAPHDEKRLDLDEKKLSSKNSEMVRPVEEGSGMLPESTALPDFSATNMTKTEDFFIIPESKRVNYESMAIETPNAKALDITLDHIVEKQAKQAYPAKDLVHRKSLPLGQQIMGALPIGQQIVRTLPLIRNMSRKASLPSESIIPISEKPPESHDIRLLLNTPETVRVPDVNDNAYLPAPSLPITSPVVTDTVLTAAIDEMPISRQMAELRDFTKPSNSLELDMVLAPVTRTPLAGQERNYPQRDEVTQFIQRTQMSPSSQTIVQTQPEQSPPPSTTQASTAPTTENTENLNNYKPDVKALAREIYPLIRRMIIIERERRPSR
jgi:hypothetical protein